jgi:hypothetical protein
MRATTKNNSFEEQTRSIKKNEPPYEPINTALFFSTLMQIPNDKEYLAETYLPSLKHELLINLSILKEPVENKETNKLFLTLHSELTQSINKIKIINNDEISEYQLQVLIRSIMFFRNRSDFNNIDQLRRLQHSETHKQIVSSRKYCDLTNKAITSLANMVLILALPAIYALLLCCAIYAFPSFLAGLAMLGVVISVSISHSVLSGKIELRKPPTDILPGIIQVINSDPEGLPKTSAPSANKNNSFFFTDASSNDSAFNTNDAQQRKSPGFE